MTATATAIAASLMKASTDCCSSHSRKQQQHHQQPPLPGHERCAGGFDVRPGDVHPWHQPSVPSQEAIQQALTRPVVVTANPMVKSQVWATLLAGCWQVCTPLGVHARVPSLWMQSLQCKRVCKCVTPPPNLSHTHHHPGVGWCADTTAPPPHQPTLHEHQVWVLRGHDGDPSAGPAQHAAAAV